MRVASPTLWGTVDDKLAVSELMAPLSFHRDRLALASRPKKKIVEILQFSFMTC